MSSEAMYADVILDYYRNPRNFGLLEDANASAKDVNTLCGDEVEIHMKIEDGIISDLRFSGSGCAISQASASMLTELAKGKDVGEACRLSKENVFDALGIKLSPVRVKCALLGLKVFKLALYEYLGKPVSEGEKESL